MFRLERRTALAAALCLLLAVIHTWPLATSPGTLSRNDNADAELNEWILAWVAHQLPRSPAHLFDSNIFYPERDTLAFSEPLIAPALMGAPLQWLGASPVFTFNIVLLLGFALTAWAGYTVAFEWTGDRAAGMLAGSMFAFNTHTMTRLAHVQGIHAWGLPLALLSADRLLVRARWRDAAWLALWMTAMAYTSGYLIVFAAVMIGVILVARIADWWPRPGRTVMLFGAATAMAAVAVIPVYLPYRRVAKLGLVRSIESVSEFSATLTGYLAAAGTIHFNTWSGPLWKNPVDGFFPGFVVIVLATFAMYRAMVARAGDNGAATEISHRLTRRRVVMLVAIAVTGMVLSLGTRTPVYGWLYHIFPPMQGLRAAARFGNLFLLGMAVLSAFGMAALRRRLHGRHGTRGRHRARGAGKSRVAARAAALHALRRHSGNLLAAGGGAQSRRPRRGALLSAERRLSEWPLRPQLHRSLAAVDERLQRLHARRLPRVRGLVLGLSAAARDSGDEESGRNPRHGPP